MMQKVFVKDGKVGEGIKFERIRRITGYLVGTLDRFNDAKAAEVRDRVKHRVMVSEADQFEQKASGYDESKK